MKQLSQPGNRAISPLTSAKVYQQEDKRMETTASWIASAATMIAAMMTAANFSSRVTGWGFVVFTIGSVAWTSVGLMSGQASLAITNAFLFMVNLFGVWRWLGRQARYEQGSAAATEKTRSYRHSPTLISSGGLIGAKVQGGDGNTLGTVIDAMLASETKQLNYIVVARGGVGGAGESLRALGTRNFEVHQGGISSALCIHDFEKLATIGDDEWPAGAAEPAERAPVSYHTSQSA